MSDTSMHIFTATAAKDRLSSGSSQHVCMSVLFPHGRSHGSVRQNPSVHHSLPCSTFPTAEPHVTPRCEKGRRIFQFLSPFGSADDQKMAVTEKLLNTFNILSETTLSGGRTLYHLWHFLILKYSFALKKPVRTWSVRVSEFYLLLFVHCSHIQYLSILCTRHHVRCWG